jgi:hypothetical protein
MSHGGSAESIGIDLFGWLLLGASDFQGNMNHFFSCKYIIKSSIKIIEITIVFVKISKKNKIRETRTPNDKIIIFLPNILPWSLKRF